MRIPLLLAVSPRVANPGVWVPIEFDEWQVRVEGLVDSELTLHSSWPDNGEVREDPVSERALWQGPCKVKIEIKKRGTEKSISVFAFGVE